LLSEAERILSSAERVTPAILQRVARSAVSHCADFCLIFLARRHSIPCVASAHATPEGQRLLRELLRVYKIRRSDPVSTVAQVVRNGRPKLRREISSEAAAPNTDLRVFKIHSKLGVRSALVVPISVAPTVLGAISLCYAESGRHYTNQDLPLARRLAILIGNSLCRPTRRVVHTGAPIPLVPRRARL
jgi:GAF domain-containing protein